MKKHISRLFVTIAFTLFLLIGGLTTNGAYAQQHFEAQNPMPMDDPPGGPPPPPGHGHTDNQPAPIGSGLLILLSLAGAYGAARVYKSRKKLQE